MSDRTSSIAPTSRRKRIIVATVGAVVIVLATVVGVRLYAALRTDSSPVWIEVAPGWTAVEPAPVDLQEAADRARTGGNDDVGQMLEFYSDTARAYSDVSSAAVTEGSTGLIVLRSHLEVDTRLPELLQRTAEGAAQQGTQLRTTRTTIAGREAWRVDQPTGQSGVAFVEIWFDHSGRRWSLEILSAPADVDRLAGSVRLE